MPNEDDWWSEENLARQKRLLGGPPEHWEQFNAKGWGDNWSVYRPPWYRRLYLWFWAKAPAGKRALRRLERIQLAVYDSLFGPDFLKPKD